MICHSRGSTMTEGLIHLAIVELYVRPHVFSEGTVVMFIHSTDMGEELSCL